jgi:hypothetical protein
MFTKGEVCLLGLGLFSFRATEAASRRQKQRASAKSIIFLPIQALSATSLVFKLFPPLRSCFMVFSQRGSVFYVLGLRSQVCD